MSDEMLARPSFEQLFGAAATVRGTAPGRVNLIGEHTDYNGGFVLPVAIPQRTSVELRVQPGRTVEAYSSNVGPGGARTAYALGREARTASWIDYVQGVTHVLAADGHALTGFLLRIDSTVPLGSGLSSSAALEISLLRAVREAFDLPIQDIQLALIGQRVETEFVGAPTGVMDQMASLLADESHALFLDTRSLHYERVSMPDSAGLIVINSGVQHSHAEGGYRTRRAECDRAGALLGVRELRDVTEADLVRASGLPAPLDRRVRHVVTENRRVLEAVEALRAGAVEEVGALFRASHASMRDDFEVSVPDVDLLVSIADGDPDVYGARLTGGGFGGSIVALARRRGAAAAAARIAAAFGKASGCRPAVLVPLTADPTSA